MSEWISVKDRLPEIGERVLVSQVINRGLKSEYRLYFDSMRFDSDPDIEPEDLAEPWWWADFGDVSEVHYGVTHWMPLPEGPV